MQNTQTWNDFWKVMNEAQNEVKAKEEAAKNLKAEKIAISQELYDQTIVAYVRELRKQMKEMKIDYIGEDKNLLRIPGMYNGHYIGFKILRTYHQLEFGSFIIDPITDKAAWKWWVPINDNDRLDAHTGKSKEILRGFAESWEDVEPYITAEIKNAVCHQIAERAKNADAYYNEVNNTKY